MEGFLEICSDVSYISIKWPPPPVAQSWYSTNTNNYDPAPKKKKKESALFLKGIKISLKFLYGSLLGIHSILTENDNGPNFHCFGFAMKVNSRVKRIFGKLQSGTARCSPLMNLAFKSIVS